MTKIMPDDVIKKVRELLKKKFQSYLTVFIWPMIHYKKNTAGLVSGSPW